MLWRWSPVAEQAGQPPLFNPRLLELERMVLDTVVSINFKRNYAQALDALFLLSAGRPLTRALLMGWRATMEKQAASTVNVRLLAVRKMVYEARKNGMLGAEVAANLNDVPNVRQQGIWLGNWLTKERARELLAAPDRTILEESGITRSWRFWLAAGCDAENSPRSMWRASRCGRTGG